MISIKQLNQIRVEKNVSIKQAADKLGVSRQQVTNLLNEQSKIKLDQFIDLCDLIGIDTVFIYK